MIAIDQWLFSFLNAKTASLPIIASLAIFFAEYALVLILAIVAVLYWRPFCRMRIAILSLATAYAFSQLIGAFWFRPRPFLELVAHKLIEKSALEKSFPSDHATLSFAAATLLFSFHPRLGIAAYILAAAIAVSRVLVGVHYPSDVLAGALLGAMSTLSIVRLSRVFRI